VAVLRVMNPTRCCTESRFAGTISSSATAIPPLLDERDQLEDAGRVDDARLEKGLVVGEPVAVLAEHEVGDDEFPHLLDDGLGHLGAGPRSASRSGGLVGQAGRGDGR
jgi:hypothetical protein